MWMVLILANLLSFALFGIDKNKAKKGSWRISERALIASAILFGSFGVWIGMKVFHHKTRKPLFAWGVPLLCILQL
ncbi:MAG: DUF1294 domain-containing protein, partial [Solobacterium sp.]|nr:DUF1294 domain-containing protein [Solobacterium sp.]